MMGTATRPPGKPEVWIGLVEIHTEDEGLLDGNLDAFAQVVAIAASSEEFQDRVRREANRLGFEVREMEEVETLRDRLAGDQITTHLDQLRRAALKSGRVTFGTFHSFAETE